MPVTIVVVDDDSEYRDIARFLIATLSDTVMIVGEAADGEVDTFVAGAASCTVCNQLSGQGIPGLNP